MRYLFTANVKESDLPRGVAAVARGEAISLEEPWPFGAVLVSRVEDGHDSDIARLKGIPNAVAFSVPGLADPNDDPVFVFGAHIMKDMEGMKPYIAGVTPIIAKHNCTYLARGSTVAHHAGSFTPDRVALMQFPNTKNVTDWYTGDAYTPLLKIRLRCAESREVLMMADGKIPEDTRQIIARKVPTARVI